VDRGGEQLAIKVTTPIGNTVTAATPGGCIRGQYMGLFAHSAAVERRAQRHVAGAYAIHRRRPAPSRRAFSSASSQRHYFRPLAPRRYYNGHTINPQASCAIPALQTQK
jgi:hypothetical protein